MPISKIQQSSIDDSAVHGQRNLIINGAMQVAQRGTSQTIGGYGSVDRWSIDNTADGGGQVADAPDDFEYSLKVNPDSGNAAVRQAIELPAAGKGGVFRSGQIFTLSFWLKSDNAGEVINIFIASSTSVSGTTTEHVNDTSTGLTTSTSWTRYTYTYTQASNVGGSDTCYNIVPYVTSPSGAIYITGVQLEVGETATPFEYRSYGDELQRCQRYYQHLGAQFFGKFYTSNKTILAGKTIVTMRASPTVTIESISVTIDEMGVAPRTFTASGGATYGVTKDGIGVYDITGTHGGTVAGLVSSHGNFFKVDAEL